MTSWSRAAGALALVVAVVGGACADYVGDDLRDGAVTLTGPDGPTDLGGTAITAPPPPRPSPAAVNDLEAGDCFVGLDDFVPGGTVGIVSCTADHDAELTGVLDLAGSEADWPGIGALGEAVDTACLNAFEAYVGAEWASSELDYVSVAPTPSGWFEGARTAWCAAFPLDRRPLTGSVAGSGR